MRRWIQWFAARGHKNHIISDLAGDIPDVTQHILPSLREFDSRPRRERFKAWSFHHWDLRYLRVLKWARDLVKQINPDVVHSHMLWYPGMLGAFVPSKAYVITAFNGDVTWRKDRKFINCLGVKYAIRKADAITSVSKNILSECERWGAKKTKLHNIMRGVDISRFHPCFSRDELKKNLGFNAKFLVFSPRSSAPLYNLDTIISSIPAVIKIVKDVKFVFAGNPVSDSGIIELKKLAHFLDVENYVDFLGSIPYEKMHQYYQIADVMVSVPTSDGVPSSIIETMACGAVPIASDLPTVREWVAQDKSGILVAPQNVPELSNAIVRLLKNENIRKEIAERNWSLIQEKGDQDYWMGKMEKIYHSLL